VVGALDFILAWQGMAAGGETGGGELWLCAGASICGEIGGSKNIRRCAGTRGGAWTKEGRRYLVVAAESKKLRRRPWLIPMSYSGGLG
jgi:hypothetical protein